MAVEGVSAREEAAQVVVPDIVRILFYAVRVFVILSQRDFSGKRLHLENIQPAV
jgi:hypothetical protein